MAGTVAKRTVGKKDDDNKRRLSLEAFKEQAVEAQSWLSPYVLEAGGEEFEIPHPVMLPDDMRKRVLAMEADEDLDRKDGEIIYPTKIDGELVDWHMRMARALLGPERHARFLAAGGQSSFVTVAWQMLQREQQEAIEADPK